MAGKTLLGAKPEFETQLKKAFKQAAYDAFMTTLVDGKNVDPAINASIRKDMMSAAEKYSDTFSDTIYQPIADAIYKFVLEIGIQLTPKGTLIAPQAPSGSLPITGTASTATSDFIVS